MNSDTLLAPSPRTVLEIVVDYYRVSVDDIVDPDSGVADIGNIRSIAAYLMRTETQARFDEIGGLLSSVDARGGFRLVQANLLEGHVTLQQQIGELSALVRGEELSLV